MEWFWTWGGESFGFRYNNYLYTHYGKCVGRFHEDEIYTPNGSYLGEILSDDRLITRINKKGRTKSSFSPRMDRMARMQRMDRMGRMMRMGCEDFPSLRNF